MSNEQMHTPEPWGHYIDGCVDMSPNPDAGSDAYPLSFEDYERARACVNACKGVPDETLKRMASEPCCVMLSSEHDALIAKNAELLSALRLCEGVIACSDLNGTAQTLAAARTAIAKCQP